MSLVVIYSWKEVTILGFSVKLSDFDEVKKKLESIQKKIDELNSKEISFSELFNSSFMTMHSNFPSFNEFLQAGGFVANSREDFAAIPSDKFDMHISNTTDFDNWEEMRLRAVEQYVKQNIL